MPSTRPGDSTTPALRSRRSGAGELRGGVHGRDEILGGALRPVEIAVRDLGRDIAERDGDQLVGLRRGCLDALADAREGLLEGGERALRSRPVLEARLLREVVRLLLQLRERSRER